MSGIIKSSKSVRLQGAVWHRLKQHFVYLSYDTSLKGNIRVFVRDKRDGKNYHHWLNPDEKQRFLENKIKELSTSCPLLDNEYMRNKCTKELKKLKQIKERSI